jgi:hypothetical protein
MPLWGLSVGAGLDENFFHYPNVLRKLEAKTLAGEHYNILVTTGYFEKDHKFDDCDSSTQIDIFFGCTTC